MKHRSTLVIPLATAFIAAAAALGLAACGGGGNANIEGSVSGIATGQSVTLQDNGSDTITVTASGSFTFPTQLSGGSSYNVTVLTQPAGQVCQVANGTGSVDSNADTVNTIAVACVSTATLTGTVSGLTSGTAVTLSNGSVLLPVATNGPFAFPGLLTAGTSYQVTVATQPAGLSCTVTNGSGSVPTSGTPTAITVTCS
jgi:hypothetical protein